MNVYAANIIGNYELYTGIIVTTNEERAKTLISLELIEKRFLYSLNNIDITVIKLPLTPIKDEESVVYLNGYSE